MTLAATVVDPLTGPVPPEWDAFVERHQLPPMWRSSLLLPLDWCARAPSWMVLVGQSGGGEAVALFHARMVGRVRPGRFVSPGRAPLAGLVDCHLDSSLSPGVAFAGSLDDHDRTEACRVFERALRRRRPGAVAVAYRHLRDRHLSAVLAAGRVRLRRSPVMVLPNRWPDLASYLASLSRKWRANLRRIRRDLEQDPDLRVELAESIDPFDACWLAEVVRRRYWSLHLPRPPRPPAYFRALADLPGTRFLTYRDGAGRLLGYVGLYDDGQSLLPIWWGARADRDGGRDNLYFDQYLRLVQVMITTGRERLLLGPGMPEIKARYGAGAQQRWAVVGR